jgi:hypothetical protein
MKKKFFYSLFGIIILLVLTNPSLQDFKEHIGYNNKQIVIDDVGIKYSSVYKVRNCFIFSMYSCEGKKYFGYNFDQNIVSFNDQYFGIFGNFYKR